MSSGNGKNTVYVKKFADGRSVSVTARAETWTTWDDSMLSAVEQAIQHFLAPKEALLKLPHAIMASKWLFQSKWTQLEEMATNGYPSVEIPDDDSDAETTATTSNSKRLRYFYWAQSVLHAVLLDSFQESDPQVFKTHSIFKLDQAALARHSNCVGDENAADKRIPYASNMYVALKTKYDTHSSTDCFKTVMAYDVARSSFNPQALVAWTDTLWNRWSDLVNMQESLDAEYVAVLRV